MEAKPGARLRRAVGEAQVVVGRPPDRAVDLRCGGAPLLAGDEAGDGRAIDPGQAEGTLLGKRYWDEGAGIELLCTRAGQGSLTCDGARMAVKGAKPLPA